MHTIKNFFEVKNLLTVNNQEIIEKLIQGKEFWLERIISTGQVTPEGQWYDQETNEWVILLKGNAKLLFEENLEIINLKSGDYLFIPAHKKHRVEFTDPNTETIWLAIHYYD